MPLTTMIKPLLGLGLAAMLSGCTDIEQDLQRSQNRVETLFGEKGKLEAEVQGLRQQLSRAQSDYQQCSTAFSYSRPDGGMSVPAGNSRRAMDAGTAVSAAKADGGMPISPMHPFLQAIIDGRYDPLLTQGASPYLKLSEGCGAASNCDIYVAVSLDKARKEYMLTKMREIAKDGGTDNLGVTFKGTGYSLGWDTVKSITKQENGRTISLRPDYVTVFYKDFFEGLVTETHKLADEKLKALVEAPTFTQ